MHDKAHGKEFDQSNYSHSTKSDEWIANSDYVIIVIITGWCYVNTKKKIQNPEELESDM